MFHVPRFLRVIIQPWNKVVPKEPGVNAWGGFTDCIRSGWIATARRVGPPTLTRLVMNRCVGGGLKPKKVRNFKHV